MPGIEILILIITLVFSIVIHEVAHGVMANYLGDPTAKRLGRLTLNPLPHIDPIGSIFLPGLLALTHSPFLFGWAKPVPYNPYNISHKHGEALVAVAGPLSNLALAVVFGIFVRVAAAVGAPELMTATLVQVVALNIMLALFNLLPLPPLDGSKILPTLLPSGLAYEYNKLRAQLETNITLLLIVTLILLSFVGNFLVQPVLWLTRVIVGG